MLTALPAAGAYVKDLVPQADLATAALRTGAKTGVDDSGQRPAPATV
ncbi:MAG TPA: hypothetical protein VFC19_11680 [Candidatus Limnocylindrales bacterium]|nr:hypothetical protein [Candidatus Limnocylindrales bacterium]